VPPDQKLEIKYTDHITLPLRFMTNEQASRYVGCIYWLLQLSSSVFKYMLVGTACDLY